MVREFHRVGKVEESQAHPEAPHTVYVLSLLQSAAGASGRLIGVTITNYQ